MSDQTITLSAAPDLDVDAVIDTTLLTVSASSARHQPLIQALKVVESHLADTHRFYPADIVIPIKDVIPTTLQTWIYQPNAHGKLRIRRTRYELCVAAVAPSASQQRNLGRRSRSLPESR